jgi:hypothetical protein
VTSPTILLDDPGPFAPGATITGRIEGLPPDEQARHVVATRSATTGKGGAVLADLPRSFACKGQWLDGGRFAVHHGDEGRSRGSTRGRSFLGGAARPR